MRKGYAALAVVGVAAALAVIALTTQFEKKGMSLYSADHIYTSYMSKYGKSYGTKEEYEHRKTHFTKALQEIEEINSQSNLTYWVGINEFADWTDTEKASLTGLKVPHSHHNHETEADLLDESSISNGIDWRSKLPPVKNQGSCGSCWAFSAAGAIEGNYAIKHGSIPKLSEQQLVDCSRGYGNQGCNGGWYYYAFSYVKDKGIASSSSYPYVGYDQSCKYSGSASAKLSGYANVQKYSISQLKAYLNKGPVSVAVDASSSPFYYYQGGIINSGCGTSLDHAILAVGYGDNYWIVRNSWGSGWGESGYVRIAFGNEGSAGICGILSGPPSYPNVQ